MEWIILFIIFGIPIISSITSRKKKQTIPYKPAYSNPIPNVKINTPKVDISNIKLSEEQNRIYRILEDTTNNVFITGKAGTGKSALLQYFRGNTKKKIVVTAPTGVAALNVNGQTIHSLFKIPPEFIRRDSLTIDYKTATLLRNIDAVVIDEISMVRADLMDAIDHKLRLARNSSLPFGGVQLIMFGDLYQLPPVVADKELHKYFSDNNGGYYFFNAFVWNKSSLDIYELTYIFRQKEKIFKDVLNAIRTGKVDNHILSILNFRVGINEPSTGVIKLVTTNQKVTEINRQHLDLIPEKMYLYKAIIQGDLERSSFPTEVELCLKKGAQVMLLKNDKDKRWVNGSIGFIDSLSPTEVKVNIDGIVYCVPQETWSKIRYSYNQAEKKIEEEVVSSFTQFPLRLAWAITIHKSQGQTYSRVVVDLDQGAFAHGQTYVALSRCTSLDGLFLSREVMREDIIVDPPVINFMSRAKILSSTVN